MANSGCPTYRKGDRKASMQLREGRRAMEDDKSDEAHGELEDVPKRSAPVEANGPRDLAEKLAEKAMRVLEEDLDDYDPRVKQEAARTIIAAWTKFADKDEPERTVLTPEERVAALVESLKSPDPELKRALETVGLLPAKGETDA